MGDISIMTDDDAKDVAKAIEKIINRNKIHISVDKAKRICATIKMMEAVGYDLHLVDVDNIANPATCAVVPSVAPVANPVFNVTTFPAKKKVPLV